MKKYVESNPDTAKALQGFAKNPEAMRGWLQTQAIAEHYNAKMSSGDAPVQDRMKSLESDPELGPIFEDIKKNGLEAAMKYYQDEELMLKVSQKMGGLPTELSPVLQKIEDTPMTLHEAAKRGDLTAVKSFLDKKKPLDSHDHKVGFQSAEPSCSLGRVGRHPKIHTYTYYIIASNCFLNQTHFKKSTNNIDDHFLAHRFAVP